MAEKVETLSQIILEEVDITQKLKAAYPNKKDAATLEALLDQLKVDFDRRKKVVALRNGTILQEEKNASDTSKLAGKELAKQKAEANADKKKNRKAVAAAAVEEEVALTTASDWPNEEDMVCIRVFQSAVSCDAFKAAVLCMQQGRKYGYKHPKSCRKSGNGSHAVHVAEGKAKARMEGKDPAKVLPGPDRRWRDIQGNKILIVRHLKGHGYQGAAGILIPQGQALPELDDEAVRYAQYAIKTHAYAIHTLRPLASVAAVDHQVSPSSCLLLSGKRPMHWLPQTTVVGHQLPALQLLRCALDARHATMLTDLLVVVLRSDDPSSQGLLQ